jgi:hypothetical protein
MALELKLTLQSVTADCEQLTLIDETTYGGANPERTDLAVIVIGYKKGLPSEADQQLTVSGNDNDPLTDISWIATSTWDGWHSFPMYAVPEYSAVTLYSLNQCVYHVSALYKCLAATTGTEPGTDPLFWELLPTDSANLGTTMDALEAADNVTYDYFNFIVTCRSEICYSKAVAAATNEGCCEGCTDAELKQTYERLDVLLNSAFSLCTQLRYAEAEEVVRNITHICEKSKCICD